MNKRMVQLVCKVRQVKRLAKDNIIINNNKDKPKRPNDGGHTPFGVDIDPNKDLVHNTNEDGSYEAYYKGSKMRYNDYINELEGRFHQSKQGKGFSSNSIGLFGGFGKGTLKKPYKENN